MASYTVELRKIQNSFNIFDKINYDLYNNELKNHFEKKFINHFYFREIGVETVERFLFNLQTMLNEIYPYYKHLYETTSYIYDPILNYDVKEEIIRELKEDNKNIINNNNNIGSFEYDTPVTSSNYKNSPSFINERNENSLLNGTINNNTNEKNTRRTSGNIGVMTTQDLIKKEREIIINIDSLIFDELEILFMQIF